MTERPTDGKLLAVMQASEAAKDAAEEYLIAYAKERGLVLNTVYVYPCDAGYPRFELHAGSDGFSRSNKVFMGGSGRRDTYTSPAYGIKQAEETIAEAAEFYKKRYGGK